MSIKASVGLSQGDDSHAVGANAAQEALERLGVPKADILFVFSSSQYDQEKMLAGIRSVTMDTLLVGCSTAGEITTEGPVPRASVAIMAVKADGVSFFAGVGELIGEGAHQAGAALADSITKQAQGATLGACIMLSDVLTGNGADVVKGAISGLGDLVPIVGGAAGDDFEFRQTFQYLNDKVYSGAVVGVALSGAFKMGTGVRHGWIPIGLPKRVTRSEGSVLHELDGRPAISLYEEYFGPEQAAELKQETLARLAIMYPLGMRVKGSDEFLIRDPIFANATGSITCAAEIPEGSDIRLMIGSREEALRVAREAAANALAQLAGATPKAVIIFSSVARSKLFGERNGEEINVVQEIVGQDIPLVGFYTYGEHAPLGKEVCIGEHCNSVFHNETIVVVILGE